MLYNIISSVLWPNMRRRTDITLFNVNIIAYFFYLFNDFYSFFVRQGVNIFLHFAAPKKQKGKGVSNAEN